MLFLIFFVTEAAQYECSYRRTAHHATDTWHSYIITKRPGLTVEMAVDCYRSVYTAIRRCTTDMSQIR